MTKRILVLTIFLCAALPAVTQQPAALKDAFKNDFLIGVAINAEQIFERDARGAALIRTHFNSISPENILKWEVVHPKPKVYDFSAADRYVEFGEKNHMFIVGHTLVWHNQTPKWVFEDDKGKPLARKALLARMREHIHKVVGRYRGRIKGWDVVNEAISNEDGTMRKSPWQTIIGDDYVAQAFRFAHDADPQAELYYNDYALENEPKGSGAVRLLKQLQAEKVPVTGVGLQGHNDLKWPTLEQEDATLTALENLGLKVMITELDIDVLPPQLNPYRDGLPDSVQQALAERYAGLFRVFLRHRKAITRVTFWCLTDADSWKNYWPVKGRTNYPLLFDREGRPKPAFHAVISAK